MSSRSFGKRKVTIAASDIAQARTINGMGASNIVTIGAISDAAVPTVTMRTKAPPSYSAGTTRPMRTYTQV